MEVIDRWLVGKPLLVAFQRAIFELHPRSPNSVASGANLGFVRFWFLFGFRALASSLGPWKPLVEPISSFLKCAVLLVFVAQNMPHRCKSGMGFLFWVSMELYIPKNTQMASFFFNAQFKRGMKQKGRAFRGGRIAREWR